ncbi:MAG: SpoOM family protein [Bacteroidetes bacterium SW_9_63_38]|nr:MAG: SpoOM family protein [Bacteroidetes bacterium SW_9_63_38]
MALLSRFGIGSATIDLIPEQTTVQPGGEVAAHLEIEGGTSAQTADDIEIALVTRYQVEHDGDRTATHSVLWETEFKEGLTVEAEVDRTIDVPPIQVPATTPVTLGESEVWIQTGLDIEWAVDPSDEDQLDVQPGPRLQAVLDAMEQLGFGLRTVTNEETDNRLASLPFMQRFAFRGGAGDFAGKLDDLFLAPLPTEDEDTLTVLMWVDRIGERDIGDVRRARLSVDTKDADAIAEQFRGKIESRL